MRPRQEVTIGHHYIVLLWLDSLQCFILHILYFYNIVIYIIFAK